jgi:phage gpG-like protein
MSGAGVDITVPALNALSPTALGRILRESANALLTAAQLSFVNSESPNGQSWPSLKPSTIARRTNGSSKPLLDTGRLMNSLQVSDVHSTAAGLGIDVGSNVEYSALQNFGGTAGNGARIPARQFMPDPENMPDGLRTELLEIAARHVASELN